MKRRSAWGSVGLLSLVVLCPTSGHAQEAPSGVDASTTSARDHAPADDYETARLMGLGLGGRASVAGTSAAASNAANLPLLRAYHVETAVRYVPTQNAWSYGGAFADSVTSKLAAGFIARGLIGNGTRDYRGYDFRAAFGVPLSERLGLGLSIRYLKLSSDQRTSDRQPLADVAKGVTIDASLRATLFPGFHVAALGYNLVPLHSTLAPLRFGGSIAYEYKTKLEVGFDLLADFTTGRSTTVTLGAGVGYFVADAVPLRLGYVYDQFRERHTLSASAGYVQPRYAIEVAFRKGIHADDATLLLAFRYHVE